MTKRELHDELDVLEWVFSCYNVIFSLDNQFQADNFKAISVKTLRAASFGEDLECRNHVGYSC